MYSLGSLHSLGSFIYLEEAMSQIRLGYQTPENIKPKSDIQFLSENLSEKYMFHFTSDQKIY